MPSQAAHPGIASTLRLWRSAHHVMPMVLFGDEDAVARIVTDDGEALATDVEVARGLLAPAFGLMFRRSFEAGEALLLDAGRERRLRLHMLFVPFDVDAVFLDADGRVVTVERLPAWRGRASARARYALELPAGVADEVEAGDELVVEGAD